MSAFSQYTYAEARQNSLFWGRLTESAVGAHFLNQIRGKKMHLYYWLERNQEVDFILQKGDKIAALEVKSSYRKHSLPGMSLFAKRYPQSKKWLVGADGIPIQECLSMQPEDFI
jgi:hypothetical protein